MNERMARVETNIENIKEDVQEIKAMLNDHVTWEEDKYSDLDKKYAPKWVQTTLITLLIGLALSVVSFISVTLQ
jgi:hypothetical protein